MKYYQEITLLPGPEIPLNFLWSKVYQLLHPILAASADSQGQTPFGVSFPGYTMENDHPSLGDKLRIFAPDKESLEALQLKNRFQKLEDYLHIVRVPRPVPETVSGYSCYARIHQEANGPAKARRYSLRNGISLSEAQKLFPSNGARLKEPYIRLNSKSTGQKMLLFIRKTESAAKDGRFNTYGLSNVAAVPEF